MSERGILFSGPMVQAILADHKTQTRRVVKPQPELGSDVDHCPYGVPGDRLWVKEAWRPYIIVGDIRRTGSQGVLYAVDNARRECPQAGPMFSFGTATRWRPSIFMPRWASRITLEITDVRVQRVNEITDADALAEGVDRTNTSIPGYARQRFQKLWDSIDSKRGYSWESNPWVFAITFKRQMPEEKA